jgi:hypothetical protein
MIQGLQEFLDVSNDITASNQIAPSDIIFDTSILNYDSTNSSAFKGKQIG